MQSHGEHGTLADECAEKLRAGPRIELGPEWQRRMHRGFEREMSFLREAGIEEGDTHILGPVPVVQC